MNPLVSINIGTFNSMKYLPRCIESIRKSSYKNIEIIGLDSWSIDGTVEYLSNAGAKIVFASTLGECRKLGAIASEGEYILILDSDQILESDLIEECVKRAEAGADAISFFEYALPLTNSFIEKCHQYDKELFHNAQDDNAIFGDVIPRFFRTSFYRQINFDKNPPQTMEHNAIWEQISQMNPRKCFVPVKVWHKDPSTTKELWRKFFRNGRYYIKVLEHHKKLALFHSLPRRTYFSIKALKHPILWLGLWYIYFIKALATIAGVINERSSKLCKISN